MTQINPFHDAHETSLSDKSERDWNILRSHWSMYSGFSFCRKLGRKWTVEGFGISGPLFTTKKAAEEYVTNLILAESRHRCFLRYENEAAA